MRLAKHADRATGRQQCKGDQSKLHGRPSFGRRNISGLGKKPPLTISTVTGAAVLEREYFWTVCIRLPTNLQRGAAAGR
jgi:hypothetical protein